MTLLTKLQKQILAQELEGLGKYSPDAQALSVKIQTSAALGGKVIQDSMMIASSTRNRLLITSEQQKKLARTTVGFFGLSVGSHAALTWMMLSRAKQVKIADPDSISPSNLNRLRLGWSTVGKRKVEVTKEALLDIHPLTRVYTLVKTDGKHMKAFCREKPQIDCIVDEIDDLEGKLRLRKIARELRIPLVSAVDVGENVILDIERHDMSQKTKFFLGRIPNVESLDFASLTPIERARLIISLVGLDHNSVAMLTSLLAIGKDIGTWPQLGTTATIAGGIVATTIKRIMLGEPVKSGRYVFDMDSLLEIPMGSVATKQEQKLKKLIRSKFKI